MGMNFKAESEKRVPENTILWSEIGQDLENQATHPPSKIRGVPPV